MEHVEGPHLRIVIMGNRVGLLEQERLGDVVGSLVEGVGHLQRIASAAPVVIEHPGCGHSQQKQGRQHDPS